MASDLKIEIFACTLFYKTCILKHLDEPNILKIFGDECCKVENIDEVLDELFIFPIVCRRKMFKSIYLADFTDEIAKSLTSLSECYNYVSRKCDYLFGGLTVFERVFATFAFVLDFCTRILKYDRMDLIENGHIFWAMYFDKFTEEFYLGGGWPRLKEIANAHREVVNLLLLFRGETNFKLKEAAENYFDFKNSDHYEEHKMKQKENVSKQWIKFRKQRFENYIRIPTTDQYFSTALEFENLLDSLKIILGLCLKQSIPFTERKCSEIHTDDADNKINTNDAIGIQHLPERKCETSNTNYMQENMSNRNLTPCNFPDAMLLNYETEDARGNEKLTLEKSLETSRPKKETDLKETDNKMEMIPISHTSEDEYNEKISTHIPPTRQFIYTFKDELCSSKTKIEETSSAFKVLSTSKIRESLKKKFSPLRVPEVTHLCSQSDSDREINQTLEATHSEIGDDQTEDDKRKTTQFTSEIAKSESEENSHILPARKFLDTFVDDVYSSSPKIEETPSALQVLSTSQIRESLINKKISPRRVPEVTHLCSQSDSDREINQTLEATDSEIGDDKTEDAKRKAVQFTIPMTESESDENSHILPISHLIDACKDELVSRNTEIEETPNAPKVLSTKQITDSKRDGNTTSDTLPIPKVSDTCKDELFSRNTKIEETQNAPEVFSTKQITESKRDGNTTSDTLPIPKVSSPANVCENTTDEIKQIDGKQEDIRKEQEDSSVQIFLRMIVVLDDREGTKLVRQELQSFDEDSQKTEVITNKKKKKSKKKSKKD